MKIISFLVLLLVGTVECLAKELDSRFQILPKPQKIEVYGGSGISGSDLNYVVAEAGTPMPILGNIVNSLPQCRRSGKGVVLTLSEDTSLPESKEGYVLNIHSKGISIEARGTAGLFYGCQTLEQLLEDSRDFKINIPFMKITDYPDISYRAVHFDNKHHLNTMKYYYECIDKLARYKVNAVMWEVEDKLRYARRPEVASPNAISKQEMQALSRYAMERNVEISPLIQGLGHASYILKHHWELREDPMNDWTFCPSHPGTYEVLFSLYLDAMEAMPYGRYLHIGGDEISAIGIDDRCKATGKSPFELQMMWLNKVCKFISDHGRTPIFWDDMPFKHAGMWGLMMVENDATAEEVNRRWNTDLLDEAIDLFPKECVYMRWKYDDSTTPANKKALDWYQQKGLKVMGATTASDALCPYVSRGNSCAPYIKGFSQIIADRKLEGIFATAWDDGSAHWETVWRGFIAQGEFGWNPNGRSIEKFKSAHAQREFGFAPKDSLMFFLDIMEKSAAFFDQALVTSGLRNPACSVDDFVLIDLPDKEKSGAWTEKYKEKVEQSKVTLKQHEQIMEGIMRAKKHALRNRYNLDIYEQTQNLLIYPSQLINALHDYDVASIDNKKHKMKVVREVCSNFKQMRKNFENVYSEVRFMENPAGYIGDSKHHHHLAGQTDNCDWWFLYEKPMVVKTLKWVDE